jgi:hypothetical protein
MNKLQIAEQFRKALQMFAASLDDEKAMEVATIYDHWVVGKAYAVGEFVLYGENSVGDPQLYKVVKAHTSQADWTPDVVPSLWTVIDEEHKGTISDPIPYDGNMALENGKYYSQDGVIYYCNRDTVNPVYSPLKDLVGLFVEVANG